MIKEALVWKCCDLIDKTNICPDSTRDEMNRIARYAHDHGYLYVDRNLNTFVCGYRIPEVTDKWKQTIPEKETGEIFFVNFAISEEPNTMVLLKMLRNYLKANKDVKEIVYFRRNNDKDFKRIHLRRPKNV